MRRRGIAREETRTEAWPERGTRGRRELGEAEMSKAPGDASSGSADPVATDALRRHVCRVLGVEVHAEGEKLVPSDGTGSITRLDWTRVDAVLGGADEKTSEVADDADAAAEGAAAELDEEGATADEEGAIADEEGAIAGEEGASSADELLVATDWARESLIPAKFAVMPIGDDSLNLVHLAPRRRCQRVLDLCTGSGVQALVAAAVLIGLGVSQSAAISSVRAARPGSLRNPLQLWFLWMFARRHNTS